MKTTIEIAREYRLIMDRTDISLYTLYVNKLESFRKACEADFISRCEFIGYERKGMLFNEDDISTESLYTKLYNLPKE